MSLLLKLIVFRAAIIRLLNTISIMHRLIINKPIKHINANNALKTTDESPIIRLTLTVMKQLPITLSKATARTPTKANLAISR